MDIKNVIVFGATGVQGKPQVLEALRQGYTVKAVSRNPDAFSGPEFKGVVATRADYDDPASLEVALEGVDAVLLQMPAMGNIQRLLSQCANLVAAIKKSNVRLLVFNSSMWAPDEPCGDPAFDGVLQTEEALRGHGFPVIVFRPTVFMNNLHEPIMRYMFVNEGVYRYPHKADLASDWICLEDVAKFMVAALKRPDLIDRKIHIGGPERLTTLQAIDILSDTIGKPIRYESITPRQLGEKLYEMATSGQGVLGGDLSGVPREAFVGYFDHFYTFINEAPQKPFQANVKAVLELIPVPLTDMRTWARSLDWS